MGEHLPAVVAIAAAAAPPPRERRCHTARKEEAAEAADFPRRLYVYIPVEDVGLCRSGPLSTRLLRRKVNYVVTPFMTRIRHIVFIYEMGFDGAE